jgi:histidine ammonia-lyase
MSVFLIDPDKKLSLADLTVFLKTNPKVSLSDSAKKNIINCRSYLDKKLQTHKAPIYGINTGFGSLCNVVIPDSDLETLQENLVKSHACGTGDKVPAPIVRLMLVLKVQSLSYGKSGVQLQTVERLIDFLNLGVLPIVYQLGSLGASGDLAPLAHLCLPLLGMGEVEFNGEHLPAKNVLQELNLLPIKLKSKEGLALLNGTQFMSAYFAYNAIHALQLSKQADFIAAISLEAFDGRIDPFKIHLHTIRPHAGQLQTSEAIRNYLSGSELIAQAKTAVQDPYSFRCVPQVHGATKDTLAHVVNVIETEINSVTDNPTIFPEEDEILSGGNFHGQPLALALDFLCIAMAELGSISERRTYLLISGQRGLPPFLAEKAGLNSGFMIPQYTAASIVSQNKQLCTPASIDSIVSSNGQEDHVSMGANAATKCYTVVKNVSRILAIELLNATQALEFRRPKKSSSVIEKQLSEYRKTVAFVKEDVYMHEYMRLSELYLQQWWIE